MTRHLRVVAAAEPCQEPHEPGPDDPIAWTAWALDKQRTHFVERCPDCGRYVLWYRRATPVPGDPT